MVDQRAATTADFLSLRRAMAVVLANSVTTKSDVAKIHSLANATSLSVGSIASASWALVYNAAPAAGDHPPHPSPRQSQQQQSGAGTPAVATPQVDEPVEVPWAIPVQDKLSEVYQNHVLNGTGPGTAFLTTMQVDDEIARLVSEHVSEPLPAAKLRLEEKTLTKSNTSETGLAPNQVRVFIKRVLPRWQDKFTRILMEGFHERACSILNKGKKSGHGTRGHIPRLQAVDALTCLKDNGFFAKPNGREVLRFATKHAFIKLGCLPSVYVEATVDQAAYLKMRTGLYARIVSSVRWGDACPGGASVESAPVCMQVICRCLCTGAFSERLLPWYLLLDCVICPALVVCSVASFVGTSTCAPVLVLCLLSGGQVYHGLRKVAGYPGLSDAGGNTDVVTRKVWAVFLSLIDDLRPKDTRVEEGLMLTDGADALRAVVPDVPIVRQQAARREIAITETGSLPPSTAGARRTRATPVSPSTRRRRGTKRAATAADDGGGTAQPPRKRHSRRRRSAALTRGEGDADSTAAPSVDDALPPVDGGMSEWASPRNGVPEHDRAGSDGNKSGGCDSAPDNLQDMLAELDA
eukprot:TRINITY_DN2125_c0_g1_i3.p1 TRINITY_DN2125_c0_g1~~TRINITY_DN2125_c0_g1_i3.p1  ORF type:complete len:579 (-),score=75.08 TRINITY_DN2125_c0_g1_i3:268-2004(-)